MNRKNLKKAMNLIFIISIGIPFTVSILIHGSLIERLILNNYRETTSLTLQSMANHIDSYIDSGENFFYQYLFDEKLAKFYSYVDKHKIVPENSETFYEYFKITSKYRDTVIKYMAAGNDYIEGICFIPEHMNQGKMFYLSKSSSSVELLDLEEAGYSELLETTREISLNQMIITEKDVQHTDEEVFIMARQINQIEQAKRQGYVFLDVSQNVFDEIVSNFNLVKGAGVVISYPDSKPAFVSAAESGQLFGAVEDKAEIRNDGSMKIDNELYYVYSSGTKSGIYVDYIIPKSTITTKSSQLYAIFVSVWCGALLMAFILYTRLFRKTSYTTGKIMDFIHSYRPERRVYEIETVSESGIAEFDDISSALIDMKERIESLVKEEYILKLSQQAAEYKAMQTEINPHFLNNVLSTLVALNRIEDRKALEAAILNLSKMFRYTCEHGYDSTIGQECRFIESYLQLEKLRFEKRLEYRIEIEPEAGKVIIPKLLIQPIVENAMKHGFVDETGMMIQIRAIRIAERGGNFIWISIANNGQPMERKRFNESKGVGINNVKERLSIVYPNSMMWYSGDSEFCTICNMLIQE